MRTSTQLALFFSFALACTSLSPVSESHPIVGGTRDTGDPAVIAVVHRHDGFRICTGTVVAPHVVLTAAHCVDDDFVGDGPTEIFTGDDVDDPKQADDATRWVDAEATYVHPAWDGADPGGIDVIDLGIIVTKTALVPPAVPLLRRAITASDVGRTVRFVGYGRTDPSDYYTNGQRFERTSTITDVYGTGLLTDDPDGLAQLCHGDSGGPVFLQEGNREVVIGVNSTVAHANGPCTGPNHHDRVDNAWDFFEPLIEAADPGFLGTTPPDMIHSTIPDLLTATTPDLPTKPDLLAATTSDMTPASDLATPEKRNQDGCHVANGGGDTELALLLPLIAGYLRRRRHSVSRGGQ